MGLESFVAGDPIGEVAGEVVEGWIPQSWASSSIAWKWPNKNRQTVTIVSEQKPTSLCL